MRDIYEFNEFKSIPSSVQYVTLQNEFSTSNFYYLLFGNRTHQFKTGTAHRWKTTDSKRPGPIIMIGQSEIGSSSQIIFIAFFYVKWTSCCAFYQPVWENTGSNPFCWAKPACVNFSSSNCNLQGDTLSGALINEYLHPVLWTTT